MSAENTVHAHDAGHGDHEGMTKKRIWKIFWILTAITAVEFFVALVVAPHFAVNDETPHWVNPIYIVLTLVKAYFIVAFFMHLKFEKMALIMSIVVPVIFIIGLILVLTNESHYWIDLRPAVQAIK